MTVHSAKGLEFDVVFMTGLEEGLFPHENSAAEEDGLEEERRLMYVAITRARERLYLSFSQTRQLHGQTRYNLKSRFIDELPEATLKWLTPKISQYGSSTRVGYGGAWESQGQSQHWGKNSPAALPNPSRGDARLAASMNNSSPWRMGQSVSHAKFGDGVVVNLEGSGTDARIQINFGSAGMKWLALAIVKLEAVN